MTKPSYKNRWVEPPGRAERDEYRALRRELKGSRTSKPRRLEIEARLDEIAATSLLASGTPIELHPSKPNTRDLLALADRVEAKHGSPPKRVPLMEGTPAAALEAWLDKLVGDGREGAIRRAKAAPDSERTGALLTELPEHPLNKLAAELARYLWQEDKSSPKPDVEQMARWKVQSWLEKRPYNRSDLRGDCETVANAVDDAFRLLTEKDAAEPDWFVRRAEKLFDAPGAEPTRTPAVDPVSPSTPAAPAAGSAIKARMDLVSQMNLILLVVDAQWLGRLAQHSPALDSQIRGAITLRLQEHGNCDGLWLANLYNKLRPHALSAFPPRSF